MRARIKRKLSALKRVKQFVADNPLTPPNPAAAAESTAVSDAITEIEDLAESQISGSGTASGAVDERLAIAEELRNLMGSLAKAAKTLDTATHPDVATKMRMSEIGSYADLVARAQLFASTVEPIKAEFIALGASATVVEDLEAMIASLQEAGDLKFTGVDTQVGGTVGLEFAARAAMKRLRKLDAILSQVYRTNPVMLARWKTAKRVGKDPVTETATPPPTTPPVGS